MKVLNLYAGIGGNRKFWTDCDVTAVEFNSDIAEQYKKFNPNDTVIIGDAHAYLQEHYSEFDFIWSSPPCPTHSITRYMQKKKIYADLSLYQEIIFLKTWFKGLYVVENVVPYYEPLIKPSTILHRHCIWSNFEIGDAEFEKLQTCKALKERELLQEKFGFDVSDFKGDKRKILRNCVVPEMGLHIFNEMRHVLCQNNLPKKGNAVAQNPAYNPASMPLQETTTA